MPDDNSIELQSVVQRFKESSAALEVLREKLRVMAVAEEHQERAVAAIEGASAALLSLVEGTNSIGQLLSQATDRTGQAIEIARLFLEGTDLAAATSSIEALAAGAQTLRQDMTSGNEALVGIISSGATAAAQGSAEILEAVSRLSTRFDTELAEARLTIATSQARASAATDAHDQLAAKVAAVPEKYRKKFGL